MTMQQPNAPTPPRLIELRGPSGKLYGMLDPARMVIEFKRGTGRGEHIDLTPYLKAQKAQEL